MVFNSALFIGITFTLLGSAMLRVSKGSKPFPIIFLGVGIALLIAALFGPLSTASRKVTELTELQEGQIDHIQIHILDTATPSSKMQRDYTIVNRNQLQMLCQALRRTAPAGAELLRSAPILAEIKITLRHGDPFLLRLRSKNAISVINLESSDSGFQWELGALRANEFGGIIIRNMP